MGKATKVVTYGYPNPQILERLSRQLRYPSLYATKAQVTKRETQTYPRRTDLKLNHQIKPKQIIRKVKVVNNKFKDEATI